MDGSRSCADGGSVSERIEKLRLAIEQTERCRAKHLTSQIVLEGYRDCPLWEGVVETFELTDHPKANLAYAWLRGVAHSPLERPEEHYTIVLGIPPVRSPETAVRAAIMAQVRSSKKKPNPTPPT
jgi:hypothetical protein